MGRKDYTKHYNKPVEEKIEKAEEPVVEEIVVQEEPVVEESVEEIEPVAEEVKEEVEPANTQTNGVVDCPKLNVRVAPSLKAAIICAVIKGTALVIDESESTDDFYKVCTASGAEGFCMRKFIKIAL